MLGEENDLKSFKQISQPLYCDYNGKEHKKVNTVIVKMKNEI